MFETFIMSVLMNVAPCVAHRFELRLNQNKDQEETELLPYLEEKRREMAAYRDKITKLRKKIYDYKNGIDEYNFQQMKKEVKREFWPETVLWNRETVAEARERLKSDFKKDGYIPPGCKKERLIACFKGLKNMQKFIMTQERFCAFCVRPNKVVEESQNKEVQKRCKEFLQQDEREIRESIREEEKTVQAWFNNLALKEDCKNKIKKLKLLLEKLQEFDGMVQALNGTSILDNKKEGLNNIEIQLSKRRNV